MAAGIGDDAALLRLPPGDELLVTTDLFVEGLHFHRRKLSAASAGRRALFRALSDIAAMGGRPRWAFLSLALPTEFSPGWVRGFLRGFARSAGLYGVALAGGDTGGSGSAVFLADVVICGSVPTGAAILRRGARAGDAVFVSGRLGASARGLKRGRLPAIRPRLELGQALRRRRLASAMIDVSDGLSTDLHHLVEQSGAAAEIEAARIPRAGSLDEALNGGEDYELLFTVRPSRIASVPVRLAGVRLTRIGRIVKRGVKRGTGGGVRLAGSDGRLRDLPPGGWKHF